MCVCVCVCACVCVCVCVCVCEVCAVTKKTVCVQCVCPHLCVKCVCVCVCVCVLGGGRVGEGSGLDKKKTVPCEAARAGVTQRFQKYSKT